MRDPSILFSLRAQTSIMQELERFPDVETGGLLLGYSSQNGEITILEATDSGYNHVTREEHCFQYDDDYETHVCSLLSSLYQPPLSVIGIWHKHNQSAEIPFSQADEAMHDQLLQQCPYPCLSVLFEKTASAFSDYTCNVYCLSVTRPHKDVTAQVCTMIDDSKHLIQDVGNCFPSFQSPEG